MKIQPAILLVLIVIMSQTSSSSADSDSDSRNKPPDDRPNIVLVMADDQGWGDMAYNGHPELVTPNFDEAARTGLKFNRFYAAAPVCSPTRASVLTGRHPNRMGVFKWGFPLRPQEVTIAEVLREHGYATAHFGKWHLGSVCRDSLAHPGCCGFAHWISAPNFYDNNPILCDNGIARQYHGESSVVTAELANAWIAEQSEQDAPFFAVVWFGSPHSPHRAAEEDLAHYAGVDNDNDVENLAADDVGDGTTNAADEPEEKAKRDRVAKLQLQRQNFLGEVTGMDRAYGMIRENLRDLQIDNNTVLWYTSDNGALPDEGSAGEFRGRKGSVYEGGLLVPAILHWPDRFQTAMETDTRCNSSDIFPTLLDFAGIKRESDRPMDGTSLNELTYGRPLTRDLGMGFWDYETSGRSVPADKLMREMLESRSAGSEPSAPEPDANADRLPDEDQKFTDEMFAGHSAWMRGNWKLHRMQKDDMIELELYDLSTDPYETSNVAAENVERVVEMEAELTTWLRSVAGSYHGDDY